MDLSCTQSGGERWWIWTSRSMSILDAPHHEWCRTEVGVFVRHMGRHAISVAANSRLVTVLPAAGEWPCREGLPGVIGKDNLVQFVAIGEPRGDLPQTGPARMFVEVDRFDVLGDHVKDRMQSSP